MNLSEGVSASVVIVTRNRHKALQRLLTALKFQHDVGFEVLVVVGPCAPEDQTDEVLAEEPSVRVLHCPIANISAARNMGIAAAAGSIIAFIDDDAVPEPYWLSRICAEFAKPAVHLVAGAVRDKDGRAWQYLGAAVDSLGRARFQELRNGASLKGLSPLRANFAVRRLSAVTIGGFDEVFAYFLDESDFALRLAEAFGSESLTFCRAAEVIHFQDPGVYRAGDGLPQSYRGLSRSLAYFALRHGLKEYPFVEVMRFLYDQEQSVTRNLADKHRQKKLDTHRFRYLSESQKLGRLEGIAAALAGAIVSARERSGSASPPRVFRVASNRKSIVIVCRYLSRDDSGIATWIRKLAPALSRLGVAVTLVAEGPERVEFTSEGYWIHWVISTASHGALPPDIEGWAERVRREVEEVSRRRGVDVVQYPVWDVEGIRCSAYSTLVSLHTTYARSIPDHPEWVRNGRPNEHLERMLIAEKAALQSAAFVLANSQAILEDIYLDHSLDLSDKAILVPHGIEKRPFRLVTKLPREVVFLGRLERRKGVDIFVEAISQLKSRGLAFEATIIGDTSPFFEKFVKRSPYWNETNFQVLGFLPRTEVDKRLSTQPIVVVPSRYESFGLVALEAMSFGCAVIASEVGGLQEVVTNERGALVPPASAEELAAAIESLLSDEGKRRRIAESGWQFSLSHTDEDMALGVVHAIDKAASVAELRRLERPDLP